ncbi:MAG: right-handed parallel beta-helix repeat-containing protein [Prevotella sp.]|nr:right-handed parallel beta-helix repeat-containing protein [Prevotella sp.]
MKRIFYFLTIMALFVACKDDDNFSSNGGLRLTFQTDTLQMDTVFSKTPSATYAFWVYNQNDDGIRLQSVRLGKKNQTGFRVNVDGSYLDNALGSQVSDLEIRRNDSILVFVELTSVETAQPDPKLIEDDLIFSLESGVEQKVNLRAWSWDAVKMYDVVVEGEQTIESATPIIIYGGITVPEGRRLNLRNSTLYFHDGAGIECYGDLIIENCVLRGDRMDRMFDYLPYDRVSGQWKGIHLYETAMTARLSHTEIRNAENALVLDSAAIDETQVRLGMGGCIIHNAEGYGLKSVNSNIYISECQFTNTLNDCVLIVGGIADINYCTMAQFYPFSAERGAALRFVNYEGDNDIPLLKLRCEGIILTGYESDVLMGSVRDSIAAFEYEFVNSLLRTPKVDDDDSVRFVNVRWESPKDSIQGTKHFKVIDEENLIYDFHLDSLSTAQGLGCYR